MCWGPRTGSLVVLIMYLSSRASVGVPGELIGCGEESRTSLFQHNERAKRDFIADVFEQVWRMSSILLGNLSAC